MTREAPVRRGRDNRPQRAARETLVITGIAAGGSGVGRLKDGRAAFVPRTAPGDKVEVEITNQKQRWARARVVRILEAAECRRNAPCAYYDRCGGCTLQHMSYAAQLDAKKRIATESLRRIGNTEVEVGDVVGSPSEFRYRNRLSFTLLRLGSRRVVAGFHQADAPSRVLDVDHRCLLPEPALSEAWGALRQNWGDDANRLPAGETIRLTLRATLHGRVSLLVDGGFGDGRPAELLELVPSIGSIWRRVGDGEAFLLGGQGAIEEVWGGGDESIELNGSVFLQVNRGVARAMEAYVLECTGDVTSRRVIDAYCGVGVYAIELARRGAWVTGIELDNAAVAEARRRAGNSAEFLEGRVEDHLRGLLPADLVIVNPPRAGLHADAVDALVARPPQRLLYVSCDPATLARDVARMAGRFEIAGIRCFDLFPQTAHIETVAELRCVTS